MKKLLKLSTITLAALLAVAPGAHARKGHKALRTGEGLKTSPVKAQTVTFSVSKMHCESCATGLVQAATGWRGVKSADVSFAQKRALVTFDPKKTSTSKIAKEFARIGFPAKLVQ